MHVEPDVAIAGAGAAGLSLARRLARPPEDARRLTAVLLAAPPGPARLPPRTWCFWEAGAGPYDAVLAASWQRSRVRSGGGRTVRADIAPLRCKMSRSDALDALVGGEIAASSAAPSRSPTCRGCAREPRRRWWTCASPRCTRGSTTSAPTTCWSRSASPRRPDTWPSRCSHGASSPTRACCRPRRRP
ncbi:hypothetical protein HUT08_34555 [Streptomyces buecherae]|uniref:Lycopene cyclase n=1 Tax=Streptomyces buecherae TaxID=2763006 RepID=A0A7H8NHC5_9ACTN|nr:hypothetical protein HUT08_34555 [Streptomyces buecherae]